MGIRFNARTSAIETDAASIDFTQPITTPASTTSLAGLNIAEAVAAPSAPIDGDIWVTAGGSFNVRLNGVTVDLAAGGGGNVSNTGTPVNNQVAVWTDATTIEGDANFTWDGSALNIGDSAVLNLGTTTGDRIEVYGTSYTIGIEASTLYFNTSSEFDWYQGGAGGSPNMTLNSSGALSTASSITATTGNITSTAGDVVANAGSMYTGTTSGDGHWLYGGIGSYGMYGASATDGTYGGRPVGDTASNFNIYFSQDNGTGRGFIFQNAGAGSTPAEMTFAINPTYGILSTVPLKMVERSAALSDTATMGQFWVIDDAPNRPIYTDDTGGEWEMTTVFEASYTYSSTVTAANPGAGALRFDSVTIGSITNLYINDTSLGADWSWILDNLADGDLLAIRSASDPADYIVASVNGAPTDNTAWWTIPLTLINTGTIFTDTDRVSIEVQFFSQAGGGGTIGGSITDNQIAVGATTADDIEGQSNLTYVSGTILTQINTGGTARDVRHFSDSTDAVDLVLRYDGSNFEYRSETGGAGNLYMQFTQADGGVDFGGDVTATGAVTGSNLSGTNTGDQTITLTGDVTGTGTGSFATTIAAKAVDVAMLADGTDGELITWSATGVATTVATGTSGHVLTSNGAGAAPTFQAAAGGGNVSNTGTPVNNQLAVWTDATTIEGDANLTYTGTSLAVYGDQTASIIDAQDETSYDNSPTTEGTFSGGTGYAAAEVITLSDGSTITVDAVSTGVVTQFTVTTPTVTPFVFGSTLTTTSSTGAGNDDFTLTPDADNVEFEIVNHYIGTNATNRLDLESGPNYARIRVTDDGIDAGACNMWFDLNSSTTGSHTFQWSDGGFGAAGVVWNMTNSHFLFGGGIEMTERSDHAGTTVSSGRGQIWVKSGTLGGALMYTEGDGNDDHHVANVYESVYGFDNNTGATDPGTGDLKWNNAAPASVTTIYVSDTEDSGRDNSYMLGNLSIGDIIKIRTQWSGASYFVYVVDGVPTDNTGWWTIPVAPIHVGSNPTAGDFMHMTVEWRGASASSVDPGPNTPISYSVYKASDEIVNNSTTLQNDDDLVINDVATGLYRLDMVVKFRDVAVSGCGAKLDFSTTGISSADSIMWVTNKNFSGAATRSYEEQGIMNDDFDAIGLATGSGTSRMAITAYYRCTSTTNTVQFRWAQNSAQANDLEVESGSWMTITRLGPPT